MAAQTKPDAVEVAEKLIGKLPANLRGEVSTKQGAGDYVILRAGGRSVGTVRSRSVKVTFLHDGSAAQIAALAKVIGAAAKAAVDRKAEGGEEASD